MRDTRYEILIFMQNKPNFPNAQMNITSVKTMNYEQITMNSANKNKPNLCHRYLSLPKGEQTQFKTAHLLLNWPKPWIRRPTRAGAGRKQNCLLISINIVIIEIGHFAEVS